MLPDGSGGMLVVRVASDPKQPGVPLVEGFGKSLEAFTLQVYCHSNQVTKKTLGFFHNLNSIENETFQVGCTLNNSFHSPIKMCASNRKER